MPKGARLGGDLVGLPSPLAKRRRSRDAGDIGVAHAARKLSCEVKQVTAAIDQLGHHAKERGHIASGNRSHDLRELRGGRLAFEAAGSLGTDAPRPKGSQLLEQGERVAHAAARVLGHDVERCVLVGEALLLAHVHEVLANLLCRDGVEVEALHAREDGLEDLLRVGGAQDEGDVGRGLLEGLEQRVERRRGEHVDLVDDVDLGAAHDRRIVDAPDDLVADVVHARVGCRIDLEYVGVAARCDGLALGAGAIGQLVRTLLAEQGLGEDARECGLARAARPTEQVCVAGAPLEHGALEGLDHMPLAHDFVERRRAVLGVQGFH